MQSLTLTCWGRRMPVGPEVCRRQGRGMLQVGIKGHQAWRPLLHEPAPGVAVAVDAALVPFGLSEPAFEVEVGLGQVCLLAPDTQPRGKARHHAAHVLAGRIVACLALPLQDLKRLLTLGTRPSGRRERRLDGLDSLPISTHGLVDVMDCCQASVAGARSTREARVRRPPLYASRCRWSEAWTSAKASAMRRPGGCRGPP